MGHWDCGERSVNWVGDLSDRQSKEKTTETTETFLFGQKKMFSNDVIHDKMYLSRMCGVPEEESDAIIVHP